MRFPEGPIRGSLGPASNGRRGYEGGGGDGRFDRPIHRVRMIHWSLIFWTIACLAFDLFIKFPAGLTILGGSAEGLRLLFPAWAVKLHKQPLMGWMNSVEGLHRLDGAMLMALALLVCVWLSAGEAIRMKFGFASAFGDMVTKIDSYRRTMYVTFLSVLASDALLLSIGQAKLKWNGPVVSVGGVFTAAFYMAIVLGTTLVSVLAHQKLKKVIEEG